MEVDGEVPVHHACPECGHNYDTEEHVSLEVDLSDYAPDDSWRD